MRLCIHLVIAVTVLISLASGVRPAICAEETAGRNLLLFYSNDVKGETDPCG